MLSSVVSSRVANQAVVWTSVLSACVCDCGGGRIGFRPEQEVWDPESCGSHVRMWPSSTLPWQASAPSVLPAGRPARSLPPRHIWTHKGAHFLSRGRAHTQTHAGSGMKTLGTVSGETCEAG